MDRNLGSVKSTGISQPSSDDTASDEPSASASTSTSASASVSDVSVSVSVSAMGLTIRWMLERGHAAY